MLRTAAWLFHPVLADRKGLIAVATALTMPVFIGVGALAIDVSFWALGKTHLKRTVDFAAKAGAQRFAVTQDARRAADTAADIARADLVR